MRSETSPEFYDHYPCRTAKTGHDTDVLSEGSEGTGDDESASCWAMTKHTQPHAKAAACSFWSVNS